MGRWLICLFVCSFYTGSSQVFETTNLTGTQLINKGIFFIEDKEGALTFAQIEKSPYFKAVNTDAPNFGITNSVYWLKVKIKNTSDKTVFRLQVSQPSLDEIDFYSFDENKNLIVEKGGECLPFDKRQYFDPNFIYHVQIKSGDTSTFYFRVRSRDNLQVPIILGYPEAIFETNKARDFIFGLFAGIMLVMFLYNGFLFITVRDKTYLYYIIYIGTVILTQISIQGYTFQYLWPNIPFLAQWSPFIFSPAVGIASAYFLRVFLNTARFTPRLEKGFKYFNILYLIAFTLAVIGRFQESFLLISFCAFSLSMYMLLTASFIFREKYKPARYFLLAWSLFLIGVTIYSMTNFGFLPITQLNVFAMPFGAAAEVVLLSLALADRINVLKFEKEQSQAQALLVSEQNQRLVAEQNVILEQKVHERTMELEETNEELNVTLTYLKDTQAQLVNAEKMASLGQLTAGIAHEINNPINFVSANLKPLRLDISEVFEVITKIDGLQADESVGEKLKELDAFKKKIDLDYLKQEIATLLTGIEDGATRTAEIVSGLRNFSRLDESDIKEANINEGIESTLILLRSQLQNVEVQTSLAKLPMIECYPGKLNQVFMNLLSNAIYAIQKQPETAERILWITTFEKNNRIYAVFKDSGIGMSKEVKEKIFEPFFTTKDVGEGTGLGMSIVFKIVESHHAKMEIESELGKGTTVTLILNKTLN